MSRLRLLLVALGAALSLVVPSAATAALPGVPGNASLLFTVDADAGTLRGSVLTLKGVQPTTVWFTDRPDRNAGRLTTRQLIAAWGDLDFDRVAPNAALVLETAPRKRDTVALELGSPTYDAQRRTLRFAVKRLDGLGSSLSHLDEQVDKAIARRFAAATLFIDNASTNGQRCVLGQPQLFATSPTSKRMLHYTPADGRMLPTRDFNGLASIWWNVFGGNGNDQIAVPTLTAPAPGTGWFACTEGSFPLYDDLGRCQVGEVDLWATYSPGYRQGDGSWYPADGRTIEPMRAYKRGFDVIASRQATFTLPNLPSPGPGLGWMVCVTSTPDDDPVVGELSLFADPPRGVGETWLPADGRTIPVGELYALASWLNGSAWDSKTITLPKVDPPAPGLQYYIATRNEWLGRPD